MPSDLRCSECGQPVHLGTCLTYASAAGRDRAEKAEARSRTLAAALQRIMRESSDGETMAIAAEALGVPYDRTEPDVERTSDSVSPSQSHKTITTIAKDDANMSPKPSVETIAGHKTPGINPGARVRLKAAPSLWGTVDGWLSDGLVRVVWSTGERQQVLATGLDLIDEPAVRPSEVKCGAYLGDNDGTCPQLTCIRSKGHEGAHDNVRDDACSICGGSLPEDGGYGNVRDFGQRCCSKVCVMLSRGEPAVRTNDATTTFSGTPLALCLREGHRVDMGTEPPFCHTCMLAERPPARCVGHEWAAETCVHCGAIRVDKASPEGEWWLAFDHKDDQLPFAFRDRERAVLEIMNLPAEDARVAGPFVLRGDSDYPKGEHGTYRVVRGASGEESLYLFPPGGARERIIVLDGDDVVVQYDADGGIIFSPWSPGAFADLLDDLEYTGLHIDSAKAGEK